MSERETKRKFFNRGKWQHWLALACVLVLVAPALPRFFGTTWSSAWQEAITYEPGDERATINSERPQLPLPEQMLGHVNDFRRENGVEPVSLDETLNTLAYAKTRQMIAEGHFAHYNLEGERTSLAVFQVKPECQYAGENLARTGDSEWDVEAAVRSWETSDDGHREDLLRPRYDYVGFYAGEGYAVAYFCDIM